MIKIFKRNKEKSALDREIDERIAQLSVSKADPEEDKQAIDNLKELVDVKVQTEGPKYRINPNTVISAAASIGGMILVINHERLNVITTKALNLVPKIWNK